MTALALKLVVTAALMGGASLASLYVNPRIAGWLVGLPLTSGPAVFFLAREDGALFAASASVGVLAGTLSQLAFALGYRYTRAVWPVCLAAGTALFGITTWGLAEIPFSALPAFVAVCVALGLSYAAMRWFARDRATPEPEETPPWWDIPARIAVAVAVVAAVTDSATLIGPRLAGLLAPVPIFVAVMAAFTHSHQGRRSAVRVIEGAVLGWYSPAVFFLLLAVLLPVLSWWAFVVAVGAALTVQALVLLAIPNT